MWQITSRAAMARHCRPNRSPRATSSGYSAARVLVVREREPRGWFEISSEGWRRMAAARPPGRLLLEGIQNALDASAMEVSVELFPDGCVIEDDAIAGFADERLVYTVFLSDKPDEPTKRGRMGRGLKELIASMDGARVETVGTTVTFDDAGRHVARNQRTRGTRLELDRTFSAPELDEAERLLRLVVPPRGTTLKVNARPVRRPRLHLVLSPVDLETVVVRDEVERVVERDTSVSLYAPRRGEEGHLFEMGIPIGPLGTPWHVDVGQRIPLGEGRDRPPERWLLRLKTILVENLIHRYLDRRELRADWVQEVIAGGRLEARTLDAYVSAVFPRGAVLSSGSRANDRARQIGAHVVDVATMPRGVAQTLKRVLESSDAYVKRRATEFGSTPVVPDATQAAFGELVRWLARQIAGSVVRVEFFRAEPTADGLMEDATTDTAARLVRFNVLGGLRFDDPFDPTTLGVVLHELAHLDTPEHDRRFIDRLQFLAGAVARLSSEEGPRLVERFYAGVGKRDPDTVVGPIPPRFATTDDVTEVRGDATEPASGAPPADPDVPSDVS
ncbi:MAG: ATP-binding protein [Deltaproteobacteria bacterium]|nr:ATP-binding protein [Deltaproteobacteria bacterium]